MLLPHSGRNRIGGVRVWRVFGHDRISGTIAYRRLQDRDQLRRELDLFRRRVDSSVSFQQQDRYTQEAFDLVLGGAAQKAFDLSEEPDEVRNRYGRDSFGEKALLACRLVDAGVTFVTMSDASGTLGSSRRRSSMGRYCQGVDSDAAGSGSRPHRIDRGS